MREASVRNPQASLDDRGVANELVVELIVSRIVGYDGKNASNLNRMSVSSRKLLETSLYSLTRALRRLVSIVVL